MRIWLGRTAVAAALVAASIVATPSPGVQAAPVHGSGGATAVAGPITNVIDPPNDGNDCRINTAALIDCGAFWPKNGLAKTVIEYWDTTGALIPVTSSVPMWQSRIPGAILNYGCSHASGTHCIIVREYRDGNDDQLAYTTFVVDSENRFVDGRTTIYMNMYWLEHRSAATRQAVINHEIGHSLGLAHNSQTNSCMYGLPTGNATLPNADDVYAVNLLYH